MRQSDLRARAVRELIDTERTYLQQLHTLHKFFVEPCKSLGLLPPAVHSKVFGQLPSLQALNTELLHALTAATSTHNTETNNSSQMGNNGGGGAGSSFNDASRHIDVRCGDDALSSGTEDSMHSTVSNENVECSTASASCNNKFIDNHNITKNNNLDDEKDSSYYLKINVGEAFLKFAPFMKTYASYASNYQQSLHLLEEHEKSTPALRSFLRGSESRPEVQCRLVSLMIAPVQRVPRYTLLLTEILRHTPHGHPFKQQLERSVALVASAAARVDECVGEGEQLQQLLVLQEALQHQRPRIIAPGRNLIKTGLLYKANRSDSGSAPRLFFLFTDILMYTKLPAKPPLSGRGSLSSPAANSSPAVAEQQYDLSTVPCYRPGSLVCCCVLPLRHCSVIPLFSDTDSTPVFRVVCSGEDLTLYSQSGPSSGQAWISTLREAISGAVTNRRTLKKDSSAKRPLRRPALRRGTALHETDTTLRQLKASSSPLRRLVSSPPPSPVGDSSSPLPPLDSSNTSNLSGLTQLSRWSSPAGESPSTGSSPCGGGGSPRPPASPRLVAPSPRSLLKCLQPKWLTPKKPAAGLKVGDGDTGECRAPEPEQQQLEEDGKKFGSTHSLNQLGSKFTLALRKRNKLGGSTKKETVVGRPHSEPVLEDNLKRGILVGGINFKSPNSKRGHDVDDSGAGATSIGHSSGRCHPDESPLKIRVLDGSPYRPRYRSQGPYRSKWDAGEIDITNTEEESSKLVDLSTAVKPKVISHVLNSTSSSGHLVANRPIPYPGKYPRTINGHCGMRPAPNSDKPAHHRSIDESDWLRRSDLHTSPERIKCSGASTKTLRRRSRSFTPDRGPVMDTLRRQHASDDQLSGGLRREGLLLMTRRSSSRSRDNPLVTSPSPRMSGRGGGYSSSSTLDTNYSCSSSSSLLQHTSPARQRSPSHHHQQMTPPQQQFSSPSPRHQSPSRHHKSPSHQHQSSARQPRSSPLKHNLDQSPSSHQTRKSPSRLFLPPTSPSLRPRSLFPQTSPQLQNRSPSTRFFQQQSPRCTGSYCPPSPGGNSVGCSSPTRHEGDTFEDAWRREKLWGKRRALGELLRNKETRKNLPPLPAPKKKLV